jgi:hypothetical protein
LSQAQTIAALYVHSAHTPYATFPGIDIWPIERDATKYDGPWRCIAHPPCGPHGNYHRKCTQQFALAEIALNQVRRYGGIFEHPTSSQLARQLPETLDLFNGQAITIDQYRFGHLALKPTILYGVKINRWPPMPPPRSTTKARSVESLSHLQRLLTPPDLAAWIIEAVRGT